MASAATLLETKALDLAAEVDDLKAERGRLRGALEFYALLWNWDNMAQGTEQSIVGLDSGDVARTALNTQSMED